MNTQNYSWFLVPENADPGWPLFDQLINHVDYTLATVRDAVIPTHAGALAHSAQPPDFLTLPGAFSVLSVAPRGPLQGTIDVMSGRTLWINVQLQVFQHIADLRAIANPGSINLTGDSWMAAGHLISDLVAGRTVVATAQCASVGPGQYTVTIEGRAAAVDSGDIGLSFAGNEPALIVLTQ